MAPVTLFNKDNYANCRDGRPIQRFSSVIENRPINILLGMDFHGRDRDFSTVRGYVEHFEENVIKLANTCIEEEIDILILMGDTSDCGYVDKTIMLSHYNLWKTLASSVKYCASLIGNHLYFERDSNLEFLCVQPHKEYPTVKTFHTDETIFYNPAVILVDNVQFSLFNYHKKDKRYIAPVMSGIDFHVGLYHDDTVLPSNIKRDLHMPIRVNSGYLADTFRNINYAVLSHIHSPYPSQELVVDGRSIVLDIPGSMCITENSRTEKHDFVNLPKISIHNGRFTRSYVKFNTGMNKLRFVESASKTRDSKKDFSMIDEQLAITVNNETVREYTSKSNRKDYISYLRGKGYVEEFLELVKQATCNDLSLEEAMTGIIKEKEGDFNFD